MTTALKPNLPIIPQYILQTQPYVPGKPIDELERELGINGIIKLASNENPLGPSPKVSNLLNNLQNSGELLRLYPDASHYYLRTALAKHNAVSFEEIIVGNGSNELIDFLIRGYCERGDNVVSCGAAFIAYKVCASIHGIEYRESAIHPDLKPNLEEILNLCNSRTKIIFLPNPNNPTGTYCSQQELDWLVSKLRAKNILLVLDSAYMEYVDAQDFPDPFLYYRKNPNIVILRTFSKAYGLAGLRVGYGVANPEILEPLNRVKMPFNVSALGLVAAEEALQDISHIKKSFEVNRKGMVYLEQKFQEMNVQYWSSQGNFILLNLGEKAQSVYQKLLQSGIITRPMGGFSLKNYLRVTVGNEEQNKRFITTMEKIIDEEKFS